MDSDVVQILVGLVSQFGLRIVGSLAIIAIGLFVAKRIGRLADRAASHSLVDETTSKFIGNLTFYALAAVVMLIAINNLGVQISAILAALGAAGLAVGLALTGALSNLAAGIILAILRPFKIGDYVSVGDHDGCIERIDAFHTHLVTYDNETIILPNASIVEGEIINYSTREWVRVEVPIVVGFTADLEALSSRLMDIASESTMVLDEPVPEVQVVRFGEFGIDLQLEVTVNPIDREDVAFDINRRLGGHFGKGGITVPYQIRVAR